MLTNVTALKTWTSVYNNDNNLPDKILDHNNIKVKINNIHWIINIHKNTNDSCNSLLSEFITPDQFPLMIKSGRVLTHLLDTPLWFFILPPTATNEIPHNPSILIYLVREAEYQKLGLRNYGAAVYVLCPSLDTPRDLTTTEPRRLS